MEVQSPVLIVIPPGRKLDVHKFMDPNWMHPGLLRDAIYCLGKITVTGGGSC